jgi:hypothetical protein
VLTRSGAHTDTVSTDHGWVSYSPGDNAHVSDEVRAQAEQRMRKRRERQGDLLAVVAVRVYEHDQVPQVTFPPDAILGVGTDQSLIGDVVRRAQEELTRWR